MSAVAARCCWAVHSHSSVIVLLQAAYDFDFHWNVSQVNITRDPACAFPCDATKPFCCDEVWVPRLRVANAKGRPLATSVLVPFNTARPTSGEPTNDTMLHWHVQLEGTFNFNLDDRIFPMDQQGLELTLVNPFPSSTYFHYMQPQDPGPCGGGSRSFLHDRAAMYNNRLQPRVNAAGGLLDNHSEVHRCALWRQIAHIVS